MNVTGSLAILAGWLTIAPVRSSSGARRYLPAFAGVTVLTSSSYAVIQGCL
jgi:hypothetical protein